MDDSTGGERGGALTPRSQQPPLATQPPPNDWQILGETFEAMGKVGLAMTVGFTVAAAFCKLVDSGRIKIPKGSQLVQALLTEESPRASEPRGKG